MPHQHAAERREITDRLIGRGWGAIPAAIVLGAPGPRQWSWTGSLAALGGVALPADRGDLPGLVVVGDVIKVADRIAPHAPEVDLAIA